MTNKPTLDECVRALPEILERIETLPSRSSSVSTPGAKLLYDIDDLRALGIGTTEAYAILRRYCRRVAGRRRRITHEQLMDYYNSDD